MTIELPNSAGIGFKPKHLADLLLQKSEVSWLEVHPENYMGDGGLPHQDLLAVSEAFPLSMHGVGMSLGSADGVNDEHLERLTKLVDTYQPARVSEHLAWSHWNQVFLNDLLPMPYTRESLNLVAENLGRVQDRLKRTILVENPSLYLSFRGDEFSEAEFLNELCKTTGCGLLFDVNNLYVSANNTGFDAQQYLKELNIKNIAEVHLAGHSIESLPNESKLLIDDHGSPVRQEVWSLYQSLVFNLGEMPPTLIEWDTDTPDFEQMDLEAGLANQYAANALSNKILKESAA